eukprot:9660616-Lingulodinium_polyedra.AAC.1
MAVDFCKKFHLHLSFRADPGVHGSDGAKVLVLEWMQKMQFLLNAYLRAGEGDFCFTPGVLSEYVESAAFASWASGAKGQSLARVKDIRALPGVRPATH